MQNFWPIFSFNVLEGQKRAKKTEIGLNWGHQLN